MIAERFRFRKGQEPGDDIDDYIATLRGLASACNFGEGVDKKIRGQLDKKTLRRNFVNVYCWKAQVRAILLAMASKATTVRSSSNCLYLK